VAHQLVKGRRDPERLADRVDAPEVLPLAGVERLLEGEAKKGWLP
jgi:hypothetical protein